VTRPLRIGLVGDHDPTVVAHQAAVEPAWLPTEAITGEGLVSGYDGLWCVPASPYCSMAGALAGIGFAREHGRPFLGTCGGFQHALIEYARTVLGWTDALHAEIVGGPAAGAARRVVTPLACALVEATGVVRFLDGSRLAAAAPIIPSAT